MCFNDYLIIRFGWGFFFFQFAGLMKSNLVDPTDKTVTVRTLMAKQRT